LVTKEEVTGRDPKRLLIDRLPEFGYLIDGDSDTRWNRWVRGELSFSSIRQIDPDRTTSRASLTLLGTPLKLKDVGLWRMSFSPGFHEATYSDGHHYQDINGEIAFARRWSARRNLKVGIAKHFTAGVTPFKFDEALIPTELNTRLRWSAGSWGFKLDTRYDLGRQELFDAEIGVGFAVRCLEPRIVYQYRENEIGIEINLIGLGDINDLPPASPPPAASDTTQMSCSDCGASVSTPKKKAKR
jgi:hypothetical protein